MDQIDNPMDYKNILDVKKSTARIKNPGKSGTFLCVLIRASGGLTSFLSVLPGHLYPMELEWIMDIS